MSYTINYENKPLMLIVDHLYYVKITVQEHYKVPTN